jgi:hypothetical protein
VHFSLLLPPRPDREDAFSILLLSSSVFQCFGNLDFGMFFEALYLEIISFALKYFLSPKDVTLRLVSVSQYCEPTTATCRRDCSAKAGLRSVGLFSTNSQKMSMSILVVCFISFTLLYVLLYVYVNIVVVCLFMHLYIL